MIQEFTITPENIKTFQTPEWNRIVRKTSVNKFELSIKNKSFHGTLLTVNKLGNKFRVINGNHRLEAIKESREIVKVILDIYENLSIQEEKKLFSDISIESPQTLNDYLYIYKEDIPLYKAIKNLPVNVSIYSDEKSVRFKTLLDSINSTKNESKEFDVRGLNREKALRIAKELTNEDLNMLRLFFELYREGVGIKSKDNILYKPMILIPLINLFFRRQLNAFINSKYNRQGYKLKWNNLFRKIKVDHIILSYAEMQTNREKMRDIRERIIYLGNKGNIALDLN